MSRRELSVGRTRSSSHGSGNHTSSHTSSHGNGQSFTNRVHTTTINDPSSGLQIHVRDETNHYSSGGASSSGHRSLAAIREDDCDSSDSDCTIRGPRIVEIAPSHDGTSRSRHSSSRQPSSRSSASRHPPSSNSRAIDYHPSSRSSRPSDSRNPSSRSRAHTDSRAIEYPSSISRPGESHSRISSRANAGLLEWHPSSSSSSRTGDSRVSSSRTGDSRYVSSSRQAESRYSSSRAGESRFEASRVSQRPSESGRDRSDSRAMRGIKSLVKHL